MKLIVRDYLASLKERDELDAILPDLLSELGFNVFSKPSRGTKQHGVDVAATGQDEDGRRKVFLFSLKQGDLTRHDWDGTPQALRSSLDEIIDVYIPTHLPSRYKKMPLVICICVGGVIVEQVRPNLTGYVKRHTTKRLSFDEWNGDRLADLILTGILKEEILPKTFRASFQKSVAMVDEPDVSYQHFVRLIGKLRGAAGAGAKEQLRVVRQIYLCLWILFVWARDAGNVEAPYRAAELTLLNVWDIGRHFLGQKNKVAGSIFSAFAQLVQLSLVISSELLEKKIFPHVSKKHAISIAVGSRASVDVNLKLFDLLGRISLGGLWLDWVASRLPGKQAASARGAVEVWFRKGMQLIQNNSALFLPICDQHSIEISLFLLLALRTTNTRNDVSEWLANMVDRVDLTMRTAGRYPTVSNDYRDLVVHPRDQSDDYFRRATSGSTLLPLLAVWVAALGDEKSLKTLVELKKAKLEHCTIQLWMPDKSSEKGLYVGNREHGVALTDLPISDDHEDLIRIIRDACEKSDGWTALSAIRMGYWPIVLLACRHHRYPVPPQFWIGALTQAVSAPAASTE